MLAIDELEQVVKTAALDYRDEAKRRRRFTPDDPAATALEHVASDLLDRLKQAQTAAEGLTPEQYAALPHVGNPSAQLVRKWCRLKQLPGAVQTDAGWRIPRTAKRVRPERKRAQKVGAP